MITYLLLCFWALEGKLHFEKTGIRLDDQSETVIIRPTSAVTLKEGTLLILDRGDKKVKLLDKKGGLVRQFGESGQGPGEFVFPIAMIADGAHVWVYDSMKSALMKFELETGAYLESKRIPRGYFFSMGARGFVLHASMGNAAFYHYDYQLNQLGVFGSRPSSSNNLMAMGDHISDGAIDSAANRFFAFYKHGKFFDVYSLGNRQKTARHELALHEFSAEKRFDNSGGGTTLTVRNSQPVSSVVFHEGVVLVLVNDERNQDVSYIAAFHSDGGRLMLERTPEYYNRMMANNGVFSFFNMNDGILQQYKIQVIR